MPVDKGVLDIIKRLRELTFAAAAQPASPETKAQTYEAAANKPFNFGDPSAAAIRPLTLEILQQLPIRQVDLILMLGDNT